GGGWAVAGGGGAAGAAGVEVTVAVGAAAAVAVGAVEAVAVGAPGAVVAVSAWALAVAMMIRRLAPHPEVAMKASRTKPVKIFFFTVCLLIPRYAVSAAIALMERRIRRLSDWFLGEAQWGPPIRPGDDPYLITSGTQRQRRPGQSRQRSWVPS
ncbi:MAG: hypothetical protein H8E35_08690, partial [Ardenticatenia bacterium]|nr:hypothetical protein [Ardenticatenia bacterium]